MQSKAEQKEFSLTMLYAFVFAITLTLLIYSIENYPPDSYLSFFERQQAISTNLKLILFLGVLSMTMILSLLMLITNLYFLNDHTSQRATFERMDRNVKTELKKEVDKIKKELKSLDK